MQVKYFLMTRLKLCIQNCLSNPLKCLDLMSSPLELDVLWLKLMLQTTMKQSRNFYFVKGSLVNNNELDICFGSCMD